MTRLALALVIACGPSKPPAEPIGQGSGSGVGPAIAAALPAPCAAARSKVEALYRAEARAREPARVDVAVADNTAMVMADCAKDPAQRADCLVAASTIQELEARCLAPLDDEGSEGDRAGR
jgi:hypothetical protein